MKRTIIVASMLMLVFATSLIMFATPIALAEESATGSSELLPVITDSSVSVSASDIEAEAEIEIEDEIEVALDTSEDVPSSWRKYPAKTFWGHGWISDDSAGYMFGIVGVSKSFAKPNANSVTDGLNVETIVRGKLKIAGRDFNIYSRNAEDSAIPSTFDVMKGKTKVGALALEKTQEFGSFSVWTGTLTIEDRKYDVNLATNQKNVKPVTREDRERIINDKEDREGKVSIEEIESGPQEYEDRTEIAKAKSGKWWRFWDWKKGSGEQDRSGSNSGKG